MTEIWIPLVTARLCLRDFRETDRDDVHVYGSDPEVARFMDWGPNTPADTKAAVDLALKSQAASPRTDFPLAIDHLALGRVVGSVSLNLHVSAFGTAELGFCLRRDLWRQGLVAEAARALVDAGFRRLNLHRVIATCDVRNTGSYRVMEAIGMRREGCFRRDRKVKGAWRDTYLYAVLSEEWVSGLAQSQPNFDKLQ